MIRVTNKHSAACHGLAPGAEGPVNPDNPGVRVALKAGLLVPVSGEAMPPDMIAMDRREVVQLRGELMTAREELGAAQSAQAEAVRDAQTARHLGASLQQTLDNVRADHAVELALVREEHAKALEALSTDLAAMREALGAARVRMAEQEADLARLTAPAGKPDKSTKGSRSEA